MHDGQAQPARLLQIALERAHRRDDDAVNCSIVRVLAAFVRAKPAACDPEFLGGFSTQRATPEFLVRGSHLVVHAAQRQAERRGQPRTIDHGAVLLAPLGLAGAQRRHDSDDAPGGNAQFLHD